MHKMTPENRTKYLCRAMGWQGGTVHQLAEVTGCSVSELLYSEFPIEYDREYCSGHFWDTNSKRYQEEHLIPIHQGNLFFWFGVMRKMEFLEVNLGRKNIIPYEAMP